MAIYLLLFSYLISSLVALSTDLALSPRIQTNLEKWHFNYQIHIYSLSGLYYNNILVSNINRKLIKSRKLRKLQEKLKNTRNTRNTGKTKK